MRDSLPARLGSFSIVNKDAFNSLPQEIIKEVFCNIDVQDLYSLKGICSYWNSIIQELLDIKRLQVTDERFTNAINIFDSWEKHSNGRYKFSIYRAPYSIKNIISKAMIANHTDDYLYTLSEITFTEVIEKLELNAKQGGAYCDGCEDVIGSVWRTILAMTEMNYSVEELRSKRFTDRIVKSSMTAYTWYRFSSLGMMFMGFDVGLIALYPDNKTFSMLSATDTD